MPRYYRLGSEGSNFQFTIPPGIQFLLITNGVVFVLFSFIPSAMRWLGLMPAMVMHGAVWQLFTYQFMHAGIMHIVFNMLTLWMFGAAIEGSWGMRRFLRYYFLCGTGAGICVIAMAYAFGGTTTITVGASGAIFGVLMAFGMMFPNAQVWLLFLFQVPAKYAVFLWGAIEFFGFTSGDSVSHVAHLGGMLVGFLYLRFAGTGSSSYGYGYRKPGRLARLFSVEEWKIALASWRRRRLRKKFDVYMRQRGDERPDRDDYIQ